MGELVCRDLNIVKGGFTLTVPSLGIACGEKVAILGENGCGKTTLLQALAGLHVTSGEMLHDGKRWDRLSPEERAAFMAYLPQESEVLFNLTVRELAELTLYRDKLLGGERRRAVMEALELRHFEDRAYPGLSGGEKRRAMLARIFCREAEIVLLDEPTAALDMRHSAMLMRHVVQRDATIIAALHDLNLAVGYFDRFLLMKTGRILFDRHKDELDGRELEEIYGIGLVRYGAFFVPER